MMIGKETAMWLSLQQSSNDNGSSGASETPHAAGFGGKKETIGHTESDHDVDEEAGVKRKDHGTDSPATPNQLQEQVEKHPPRKRQREAESCVDQEVVSNSHHKVRIGNESGLPNVLDGLPKLPDSAVQCFHGLPSSNVEAAQNMSVGSSPVRRESKVENEVCNALGESGDLHNEKEQEAEYEVNESALNVMMSGTPKGQTQPHALETCESKNHKPVSSHIGSPFDGLSEFERFDSPSNFDFGIDSTSSLAADLDFSIDDDLLEFFGP